MERYIGYSFFILIFVLFLSSCNNSKDESKSPAFEKAAKEVQDKSVIVRKGVIDLVSIDKNNNDKVYECPMDWNVISDDPGNCPLCGMKLKEYSVAGTKANLEKYGFKYK